MVHSLNRRMAIKTAGLAFGSAVWTPALARAQAAPASSPRNAFIPQSIPFSTDLGSWADHQVSQSLAHVLAGHGTREHYHNAGAAMRIMGNHFSETGIDLALKVSARKADLSKVDFRHHPSRSTTLQQLRQYVPHLHDSELNHSFPTDADVVKPTQRRIVKGGISYHYHAAADVLQAAARFMPKAKKPQPHLTTHALYPSAPVFLAASYHPDLAWIEGDQAGGSSFGAKCKAAICHLLSNPEVNDAIAAVIGIAVSLIEDFGVTFFCSLDIAGSILGDILSEGYGIMLGPLEIELCAGAKAGALWYKAATGVAAGVAAGLLIRKLQSEIGCPTGG